MDRQVSEFCANIIEAVRRLPGVQSVAMVNRLPLGGVGQNGSIEMEGIAPTPLGLRLVDWRTVTPDYFQAMGIPLKKGRFFTERDTADAKPVGIIDERVAEIAWPNQDPIGKRFRIPLPGLSLPWFEIVGVVGHIRHDRLAEDQRPQIYWNYWQRAQDRMALVVKTSADPKSMTGSTIGAIRSVDPDQPVYDVRPMTDVADRSLTQEWLNTVLLGIFAAASLLLSGIGIYGVTAFAVGERTREFAIRMALGAQLHDVVRFVLHHAALVIAIGLGLGIAGSWILSRTISALLFNVSATDWPTFTISILVLACIALLASYIPARRAGTIDPMRLLR
jgi:predicted permease